MSTGVVDPEKSTPWAPEGASRIGAPPVAGTGGERGTNAFGGTDEYDASGFPVTPAAPPRGPGIGTSYHTTETSVHSAAVTPRLRSAAASNAGLVVPEVVLTASSTTPVHATSVTLTATLTTGATNAAITGTVTFKDGTTTLGTGTVSSGVATYTVSGGFTVGAHAVTAAYGGDSHYEPKTSAVLTITAS